MGQLHIFSVLTRPVSPEIPISQFRFQDAGNLVIFVGFLLKGGMNLFGKGIFTHAFHPTDRIDPEYGKVLRQASDSVDEVIVYDVNIDLEKIVLNNKLPYCL